RGRHPGKGGTRPQAQAGGHEGFEARHENRIGEEDGEGRAGQAGRQDREEGHEAGGEEVLTGRAGAAAARIAESVDRWTSSSLPCACSGLPARPRSSGAAVRATPRARAMPAPCTCWWW